jgi:predicted transcriptional regulator
MAIMMEEDEQGVAWLSIPLSAETRERLRHLADICHADPVQVAASLLHDVLKDDEVAHDPVEASFADLRRLN